MNKQVLYLLFIVIAAFCPLYTRAQCTAVITASSSCGIPALLEAEMNTAIRYLEWSRAGSGVIRRDTAVHATSGITVAGTGTGGSALNQLNNPSSLFRHADGSLYISEQAGHRVTRWAPGATQGVVVAGGNGSGAGLNQLNNPVGVHVGTGDTVFVLEYGNNRITKWGPGATQGIIVAGGNGSGAGLNQMNGPHGFYVHTNDTIYVAEYNGNRIIKFPPGSTQSTNGIVAIGSGLVNPVCITFDQAGNIYVGENGGKIIKYLPGSSSGTTIATGTQRARGMFVDKHNHLWVAEDRNFRIVRYLPGSATAQQIVGTGSSGSGASQLCWPSQVLIAEDSGTMYVVDYCNHRIQKFTSGIKDTLTASVADQYTVQATGFNGCTATDAVTVGTTGGPAITPGSNPSVCAGATSASLSYSGATGSPNQYSISWNTAAQTAGFTNVTNQPLPGSAISITVPGGAGIGTYNGTLTVRNSTTGCVSNTYNVSVTLVIGTAVTPGTNPSVCAGATVASLPYSGATGSPNQYSIAWNTAAQAAGFAGVTNQPLPGGAIVITVPAAASPATYDGTLTVRNSSAGCVSASSNISVTVHPLPAATIVTPPGAVALCQGQDTILTAGSGTGYGYQWKNDQGVAGSGISYTANATGNYYVVVTDANNCRDSTAPLAVTVHPRPQVSITPGDTAFCAGGFVRLEAVSADTGLDYRWKEGHNPLPATADFIEITATGSYLVVVSRTIVTGCADSSTPVNITVHPLPAASVTWDGAALHTDPWYVSYQWRISGQPVPGATGASFRPGVQGAYTVTVTDTNGCSNTSSAYQVQLGIVTLAAADVKIYPNPANTFVYIESAAPVKAVIHSMEGRLVSHHEGASLSFDITALPDGMYTVLITDRNGLMIRHEKLAKYSR